MKKLLVIPFLTLMMHYPASAQLHLNFNAPVFGQSLEGLSRLQVINNLPFEVRAVITIWVKRSNGQDMVTVKTTPIVIRSGLNELGMMHFNGARFAYFSNSSSQLLSQSRRFPAGEYEYCFEVDISAMKLDQYPDIYQNCFAGPIEPQTPLLLMHPIDGDETCEKRPGFMWQPPMPVSPTGRYQLVLVELHAEQDAAEAIAFNEPIISQAGIITSHFAFPTFKPQLREGMEYAWQVMVFEGKTIVMKSEIWQFKVICEEKRKEPTDEGYRLISDGNDGGFYLAYGRLRFSFNNPYGESPLNYSISSTTDRDKEMKGLPSLKMSAGLNKFELDLDELKLFRDGQEYILRIRLVDNRELKLKFIYKKASE